MLGLELVNDSWHRFFWDIILSRAWKKSSFTASALFEFVQS